MTSEGKDKGNGMEMMGPCGELVLETCAWGKQGLGGQKVWT